MTTPAEELRAAAAKIRSVASAVPPCDWHADGVEVTSEFFFVAEIRHIDREKAADAARHFALWHPGVAEMVAEALDELAENIHGLRTDPFGNRNKLLNIARAINGTALEVPASPPLPTRAEADQYLPVDTPIKHGLGKAVPTARGLRRFCLCGESYEGRDWDAADAKVCEHIEMATSTLPRPASEVQL